MIPVWEVDSDGNIIEHYLWEQSEIDVARAEGRHIIDLPWTQAQVTYQPKFDLTNNVWIEGYTSAQILSIAAQVKIDELNIAFQSTVNQGFSSSADGTARTYPLDPSNMVKWSGAMSVVDNNSVSANLIIKDIAGNKVTVTPDQFKQLATDGFNYFMQQEQHLWSLEVQVEACTSVDDINAITWETPTT